MEFVVFGVGDGDFFGVDDDDEVIDVDVWCELWFVFVM